jgi:UDP-N-acetylglucosamine--N-acetylmuramyl-(pentapeptide) pyrophosphoryl-undecaprenol N-acetylglucosamine transferase
VTTIVLSAGGTGGHLFPAQALAAELMRRGRSIVVMTDARGKNYGAMFPGAAIETVPSASFTDRSRISLVLAPFEILGGVIAALSKLAKLKPAAVIGFGGYPSLPVMLAAWIGGHPSAIHEQNAVLGRVNRLVAAGMRAIAASFLPLRYAPDDDDRVVYTGNPVRPEVTALAGAPYQAPSGDGPIRLLVFGGSQGARALSELVPAAIARLPASLSARLEIVQQCRPEDIEAVRAVYAGAKVKAELASFFSDMPERMAAAHLVVARSGASTIAELCTIGRPSILVPFPFATDDHQTANAEVLWRAGAAWTIQQRALTADGLAQQLEEIFAAPEELAKHAAAALTLGKPDAAKRLADLVDGLGGREAP